MQARRYTIKGPRGFLGARGSPELRWRRARRPGLGRLRHRHAGAGSAQGCCSQGSSCCDQGIGGEEEGRPAPSLKALSTPLEGKVPAQNTRCPIPFQKLFHPFYAGLWAASMSRARWRIGGGDLSARLSSLCRGVFKHSLRSGAVLFSLESGGRAPRYHAGTSRSRAEPVGLVWGFESIHAPVFSRVVAYKKLVWHSSGLIDSRLFMLLASVHPLFSVIHTTHQPGGYSRPCAHKLDVLLLHRLGTEASSTAAILGGYKIIVTLCRRECGGVDPRSPSLLQHAAL